MKFGVLFADDAVANYYEALVGTLRAAKKRGILTFEGQILLQGEGAPQQRGQRQPLQLQSGAMGRRAGAGAGLTRGERRTGAHDDVPVVLLKDEA